MKRRAVLCGINNYKTAPTLRGCLNDVENIKSLLINIAGTAPRQFEGDVSNLHESVKNRWTALMLIPLINLRFPNFK
jgi:hypothetical protein